MNFNVSKPTQKSLLSILKRYCAKGPNDEKIKPVNLAYASYENQKTGGVPPLLIVHGYLASKGNWVSVCKRFLANTKPERKIIAVDLRNHGDSPRSNEHTNLHVVEDLKHFLQNFQIKTAAVLGHSYGGMTSMLLSLLYPDLVEKLIVEDMSPKDQTKNLKHIKHTLEAISKLTIPAKIPMSTARSLVDQQLIKDVPEDKYRSFLLTQLIQKDDGNFSWRFNINVLKEIVLATGPLPEIQGKVYEKPVIFIGAEKSPFIGRSDEPDIKKYFPTAEFHYVKGASHVIHSDKPEEFMTICVNFLNKPM